MTGEKEIMPSQRKISERGSNFVSGRRTGLAEGKRETGTLLWPPEIPFPRLVLKKARGVEKKVDLPIFEGGTFWPGSQWEKRGVNR